MESIFDVFNIVCSEVWGKTTYSIRNGIAFLLSTSGRLLDALSSTKFSLCFCLSLEQDDHKFLPKHHLCSCTRLLYNCFHLMNCQCREYFNCEWGCFLGPYLYFRCTLSSGSSSKHSSLELESIASSSPHSSSRLSPISSFSPFSFSS